MIAAGFGVVEHLIAQMQEVKRRSFAILRSVPTLHVDVTILGLAAAGRFVPAWLTPPSKLLKRPNAHGQVGKYQPN
jgi:hypothetical protein